MKYQAIFVAIFVGIAAWAGVSSVKGNFTGALAGVAAALVVCVIYAMFEGDKIIRK